MTATDENVVAMTSALARMRFLEGCDMLGKQVNG
jgi:ribonuclease HIII